MQLHERTVSFDGHCSAEPIAMKSLFSNALHGYSFTLFAEYFWFQHLFNKKHHTATFSILFRFYTVQKSTRFEAFSKVVLEGRATKWPHKYAHRKHTQSTCGISAISIQLFCIPSRPVKNAISHGVVNMKNKHTRKSLPPVNYLSPDCIWPFTLLSVANYNRSLRTPCNLGIGMSNATSWIQIDLCKISELCLCGVLVISLISRPGNCSLFGYVLPTCEVYLIKII